MNNYQLKKIFNSIDLKHQIEISLIDDIGWFNINKFDFELYKTFLLLLKDVLIYLSTNNVQYIKQYILETDLEYFKKSSYIELENNEYIISTKIIDFVSEMTSVLGIKKL